MSGSGPYPWVTLAPFRVGAGLRKWHRMPGWVSFQAERFYRCAEGHWSVDFNIGTLGGSDLSEQPLKAESSPRLEAESTRQAATRLWPSWGQPQLKAIRNKTLAPRLWRTEVGEWPKRMQTLPQHPDKSPTLPTSWLWPCEILSRCRENVLNSQLQLDIMNAKWFKLQNLEQFVTQLRGA